MTAPNVCMVELKVPVFDPKFSLRLGCHGWY
jgi:hypothetical protein